MIATAMKTDVTPHEFRRAVYSTLCLSFPGLLAITCWIFGLKGALEVVGSIPLQIMAGYVVMALVIERVAVPHRAQFHYFCFGIPFAVLLFISGLFAGSAVSMLLYPSVELFVNIIWVLVMGSIIGALPAAIFGLIGTCILRKVRNGTPPDGLHPGRP